MPKRFGTTVLDDRPLLPGPGRCFGFLGPCRRGGPAELARRAPHLPAASRRSGCRSGSRSGSRSCQQLPWSPPGRRPLPCRRDSARLLSSLGASALQPRLCPRRRPGELQPPARPRRRPGKPIDPTVSTRPLLSRTPALPRPLGLCSKFGPAPLPDAFPAFRARAPALAVRSRTDHQPPAFTHINKNANPVEHLLHAWHCAGREGWE